MPASGEREYEMTYSEFIKSVRLRRDDEIEVTVTTGDVEYPGTALEVESGGEELLHFIVDERGEHQVLFLSQGDHYRLSLATLENLISAAKKDVRYVPDE